MNRVWTLIFALLAFGYGAQAQSKPSSSQPSDKTNKQPIKVNSEPKPQPFDISISKEFMPVALKAFQALDHLREHFWEDYDSDAAWTPRQMAAEKARDDLDAVVKSSIEKTISSDIASYVSIVTQERTLMRVMDSRFVNSADALSTRKDIERAQKKMFENPCYTENRKLATTSEPEANRKCGSDQTPVRVTK